MLPEPDDLPVGRLERRVRIGVPPSVQVDLPLPPSAVGAWEHMVLGAAVPEAAVDVDGETNPRERDVDRSPAVAGHLELHPIPQTEAVELATQLDFWLGVAACERRHLRGKRAARPHAVGLEVLVVHLANQGISGADGAEGLRRRAATGTVLS